jgi:hypothetical protein
MSKSKVISGKVDAKAWVEKNNGYPEVGSFIDQKSLQKFYKQLDTAALEDWASVEGLEYKECKDSEPIHRMRVAMAILYKHFPKDTKSKPESPYKKYTTEQLAQMAVDNGVAIEVTDDDRILRMRLIMALRVAGIIEKAE